MYSPASHREPDLGKQHALMRERPLGLFVTHGCAGLVANPAPMLLRADQGPMGALAFHLARANPQWRDFDEGAEALVVFQGDDAYVSPSWYATKRETGKVVPTWNYVSVHAYGRPRRVEDRGWLLRLVDELTNRQEAERVHPWRVSDAPADYVDAMLNAIVGVEIEITRIEGKWKASQNRSPADREGVAAGLRAQGEASAARMAGEVEAASRALDARA